MPAAWDEARGRLLPQLWPLAKIAAKQKALPGGNRLPFCGLHGEPGAPGCLQGDDWLRFLSFEGETVLENVLALVGLLVGFHTLAFTILVARRQKFQLIQPHGGDAKKLA